MKKVVKVSYTYDNYGFHYSYYDNNEEIEGVTELIGDELDMFDKTSTAKECYMIVDSEYNSYGLFLDEETANARLRG